MRVKKIVLPFFNFLHNKHAFCVNESNLNVCKKWLKKKNELQIYNLAALDTPTCQFYNTYKSNQIIHQQNLLWIRVGADG